MFDLFSSPFLLTIITKDEGRKFESPFDKAQAVRRSDISLAIEVHFHLVPISNYVSNDANI